MSKLFERGWPLKIFSVVMAIVIWLLITANENPEKNLEFQNIPVSVSEDQLANGLSVINEAELVTDVVIRGRSNDLLTYNAKNIQASVDLSTITKPGEYELPVSAALADNKNNTFAVVKTSPAKIKVIVDYVSEKEVPVEVTSTGEVAKNYLLGDLVPASQHILVSGPESELDTVAAAKVEINVAKLEKTTTLTGEVILVDGEGKPIDNPYIHPR